MNAKRVLLWLMIAILVASAVGCEGGTHGSAWGSRISCSHKVAGGSCKGGYKKISGTVSADVEAVRDVSSAQVEVEVSVESGPLRVYVLTPGETENSVTVGSGGAAKLSGTAKTTGFKKFRVYFEAVEGEASGITYTISYTLP
jgi:hypothetical protein